MIVKLFYLFVLTHLIVSIDCACDKSRVDEADNDFLHTSIFGDPKLHFPISNQELVGFCKDLQTRLGRLRDFTKTCYNRYTQTSANLLFNGVSREIKKICSKERQAFIVNSSKCGQSTLPSNKVCMDQFTANLKRIGNAPRDDKFEYVCCSAYIFHDCVQKAMSSDPLCTKNMVDTYISLAKGYTTDIRNLICGNTPENSSKCNGSQKRINSLPASSLKSKSTLTPFLEIIRELGGTD